MSKFRYSNKAEIIMPKVEGKAETKKMQLAVNKAIVRGSQKGAIYVEKGLRAALDSALDAQWAWTEGTRDIVDTGALKKSLEIKTSFLKTKVQFGISYGVPYAAFVHYGGVMKPYGNQSAADVVIPGRPWITSVLTGGNGIPKFDMLTPFDKGTREVWKAQFG